MDKLKGNILVLTQWSFKDALIQTYTLPYVEIIRNTIPLSSRIVLLTAEKGNMALTEAEINTINKDWAEKNMLFFPMPYERFGWKKLVKYFSGFKKMKKLVQKENIKVIHAFCMPAGAVAYRLSKKTGTMLVMDSYEPHATAMVETGAWKKSGPAFRILFKLEKKLTKKARFIIATTGGMKEYAKENYGTELTDFFVKPACINFQQFYPRPKNTVLEKEFHLEGKIVCVYAGKLGGTYLREEVFGFVKACYDSWGDGFRFLMLTSESPSTLREQVERVNIPPAILVSAFVPHKEIPEYMSLGDFAINPQVPVPSKRYGTPIKNGEYWAMGLPVVISPGVSDDSDVIMEHKIGVVADLRQINNMPGIVKQMDLLLSSHSREEWQEKIFSVAKQYRSFSIAEKIYPQIYENR